MNSPLTLLVWGFQRCPPSPPPPSFLLPRPSISCLSGFSAHCLPYLPSFCSSSTIPQPFPLEMAYCWWSAWPTEPAYVAPAHFSMSSGDVWDVWRPEDLVWRPEDLELDGTMEGHDGIAEKRSSSAFGTVEGSAYGTMAPWRARAPWRATRATASGTIAEKSSSALGTTKGDDGIAEPDKLSAAFGTEGDKGIAEPGQPSSATRALPSQASSSSQPAARAPIQGNQRRGSGVKRASGRYGPRGGRANPNVQWHTMKAVAEKEGWLDEFRRTHPKPPKK